MSYSEIVEAFDETVKEQMAIGLSHSEAAIAASRINPVLHQQYIEASEELEILEQNAARWHRRQVMNSNFL
jgi:hypothetical protein